MADTNGGLAVTQTAQDDARLKRIAYEFHHGKPSGVQFNLSVNLDMIDFIGLSPAQTHAILSGVARCIAAGPTRNVPERETEN